MTGPAMPAVALESVGRHRRAGVVRAAELVDAAAALLAQGMRLALVSGHDDGDELRVVYLFTSGPPDTRVELHLIVDPAQPDGADLVRHLVPRRSLRTRTPGPLRHRAGRVILSPGAWSSTSTGPKTGIPCAARSGDPPPMVTDAGAYPFVPVEGTGVYEIPVGPVHAGLIEPGHFRFWVVGETILRMKARLWFVHKGIERLFEGRDPDAGVQLAERISGDTAVGHALAYCQAVEDAWRVEVPAEAMVLRGVLLELERLYNHVADIGALCNDVGFGVAQAWALSLREHLLQLNARVTGHRLLRGGVVLGGARVHSLPSNDELAEIGQRLDELIGLVTSSALVMERFAGTAVLDGEQASGPRRRRGCRPGLGPRLRCSSSPPVGDDAGVVLPCPSHGGRCQGALRCSGRGGPHVPVPLGRLHPPGGKPGRRPVPSRARSGQSASGVGIVEAWRGAAVHRVELDDEGRLTRVKVVDPSFHNWPALPVSLADTIVPDFPLANKSFNLSYAGNDL